MDFRRQIARLFASQSMEFREHNVEYGYTYESSAVIDDGSPSPDAGGPGPGLRALHPPGGPLPHAWLDADDGERVSTLDLVRPGRFLLIAGEDGERWCDAAASSRRVGGIPWTSPASATSKVTTSTPGAGGRACARSARTAPSWCDPTGSSRGEPGLVPDPDAELASALSRVLGRTLPSD